MASFQNNFKVPFAYFNGQIIDVRSAEKGVNYKCACGDTVRLRGGDAVKDHFYHIAPSKCSIESAIHKAYKDVFKKRKKILLPHEYNGTKELVFDKVELEKKIGNFIPDAIGYIGDDMYFIEFAKTSFINEKKLKKIKSTNIFCLEINIQNQVVKIDEIQYHLEKIGHSKQILHVPMYGLERENKELKKETIKLKQEINKLEAMQNELDGRNAIYWKKQFLIQREQFNNMIDEIESADLLFYEKKLNKGWHLFLSQKRHLNKKSVITAFAKGKTIKLNFNLDKHYIPCTT